MDRRTFLETAALGAAAMAFPRLAQSAAPDLKPIYSQIEKRHD